MEMEKTPPASEKSRMPGSTPAGESTAEPSKSQPGLATPRVITAAYVRLITGDETHPDAQISKQLLDRCATADGFKCIRCEFTTPDTMIMAEHLAGEINKSMQQLQDYQNAEALKKQKRPGGSMEPPKSQGGTR